VLEALEGAEGFRGGYHLVDDASGDGMSISFWDDEACAAAGEQLVAAARPPGGDGGPGPSRVQLLKVLRSA
jgi:hypothetical protein